MMPEAAVGVEEGAARYSVNNTPLSVNFLTLKNPEHRMAYNLFRMRETYLPLQFVACVVLALSVTALAVEYAKTGTWSVLLRFFLLLTCTVCLYCYTAMAVMVIKDIAMNGFWQRLYKGRVYLCNAGIVSSVVGSTIRMITGDNGQFQADSVKVMIAVMFMVVLFRLADWWILCGAALVGSVAMTAYSIRVNTTRRTTGTIMVFGVFAVMYLYDYCRSKVLWFTAYMNLESATRAAVESELDRQNVMEYSQELRCFIGNVAHDFKTPLQAFTSELDVLRKFSSHEEISHSISYLDTVCASMAMLVNRSLDFVKALSGVPFLTNENTVDIRKTVDLVVNRARQFSSKNPIHLEGILPSVSQYITADRQWLEDSLLCLASNAITHTTVGVINVRVFVRHCSVMGEKERLSTMSNYTSDVSDIEMQVSPPMDLSRGNELVFHVEDFGVGLTPEQVEAIFQPSKQQDRSAGGTGIGLYALKKRVESFGGSCGVSNYEDKPQGSIFWFSIPYQPVESSSVNFCPTPPVHERDKVINVLLVDDAPIIQKATNRSLQREGYNVTVASNGVECLKALEDAPLRFNLVLLDIQMPVMDGLETIRIIREREASVRLTDAAPNQPLFVIGVSAYSDSVGQEAALGAGMDAFISKPLSISSMKECCRRHGVYL